MLRIAPTIPSNFLIFSLFDELPKGDYVVEEISNSLKRMDSIPPNSATSILKNFNLSHPSISDGLNEQSDSPLEAESLTSLETKINQEREEAKEINVAKASAEKIKYEGISEAIIILMLLIITAHQLVEPAMIIIDDQIVHHQIAIIPISCISNSTQNLKMAMRWYHVFISSLGLVGALESAERCIIMGLRSSDLGQASNHRLCACLDHGHYLQGVDTLCDSSYPCVGGGSNAMGKVCKSKHHDIEDPIYTGMCVMCVMIGAAAVFAVVPLKFIIMGLVLLCAAMNTKSGKSLSGEQGNRRIWEWWDSIPVIPVRIC
ncbi:hypothetical protein ACLOJK_005726 [Asimina triloba]